MADHPTSNGSAPTRTPPSSSREPDEPMSSSEGSINVGLPLENSDNDPSESHINNNNNNSINNKSEADVTALEERVKDLETKLLVLSRMLQLSNSNGNARRHFGESVAIPKAPTIAPPPLVDDVLKRDETNIIKDHNSNEISKSNSSNSSNLTPDDVGDESGTSTPPQQIHRSSLETGNASVPHLESPATNLFKMDPTLLEISSEFSPLRASSVFQYESKQDDSVHEQQEQQPTHVESKNSNGSSNDLSTNSNRNNEASDTFDESECNSGIQLDQQQPPAPVSQLRRRPMSTAQRNLSFKLLYGGDEEAYEEQRHSDPSAVSSMTPSERRWLGAFVRKTQQAAANHQAQSDPSLNDNVRSKWLNYLNSFQESNHDVDLQMEEFVKVPGHVESIMAFGFYICVDSFLYISTILPIRFVWSLLLLILRFFSFGSKPSPPYQFHRRHTYQMIQVSLLYVIYTYVLAPISIGKLYHWIRGQAMIKLYVLIAIVEVFDRLMCSMGQDCLDSMYWNVQRKPLSSRMLISVAVVLVYAICHTLLLFLHVATLNVAMNSADQALLTLFISGNFAEIKSTVFKKYNKAALFKLTAGDICERFKLGLFLGLVLLLNICQGMDQGQFLNYVRVCAIVWCAELLADWVKHSFITKFNMLQAKVYIEYSLLLAGDFTGIGHEGVNLDHSHAVVKRIGFAQLPLVCVMFRMLREAAKYATINHRWPALSGVGVAMVIAAVWLVLLALKLALGTLLQRISLHKLRRAPEILPASEKKKKL